MTTEPVVTLEDLGEIANFLTILARVGRNSLETSEDLDRCGRLLLEYIGQQGANNVPMAVPHV